MSKKRKITIEKHNYKMKKNITKKISNQKRKNNNPIIDKDLKKAFLYSIIEAKKWGRTAQILKKEKNLCTQTCVCYIYSIEIALKGLIMNNGINITNSKNTHCLIDLFELLDEKAKAKIINEVKYDSKPTFNLFDDYIFFNSFEEELEFISNDFIGLRYNFERFLNGQAIYIMNDFIESLAMSIIGIANERLKEIKDDDF